jgi:carboxypeptidase Q
MPHGSVVALDVYLAARRQTKHLERLNLQGDDMRGHRVLVAAIIVGCMNTDAAVPQVPTEADERISHIVGSAMMGGAQTFLQELTDSVGGRLTGSLESRAAADLLLTTLRAIGFEDAHFEEYPLESSWRHGPAVAHVVSPVNRSLTVGSYGWVPGTNGEVTVPLIDLGAPPTSELIAPSERLRGAAVLVEPHDVEGAPYQVMRTALSRGLARAGATAMLIPSDKPNRMLFTSAFGFYPMGALPVLSISKEDVLFVRRLLSRRPVRLTLNVANSFDRRPVLERNVVADIKGTIPDETVLVGAHFDSWDPGQGAQDDGSGVAALVDAARILKSMGIRPRRTIRFAFFSGEEQTFRGSRAYVDTHRGEIDRLRAVLIMDDGAQIPRGFRIHGRSDVEAAARSLLAPLAPIGASGVSLDANFSEDHAPFLTAGVPVFTLWVDEGEYDIHHHAASDTFDKVDPRMLALDTAAMAVAAYRMADAPEPPGRRLSAAEATALLKKIGLESMRQMADEPGDTR